MVSTDGHERIRIAPQGFATPEHEPGKQAQAHETTPTRYGDVRVAWEWDGETFRMDITAPHSVALEIALPVRLAMVYVNGQAVWDNSAFQANGVGVTLVEGLPAELRLMCPAGGSYHILACAS
jgi:hypothetical protein